MLLFFESLAMGFFMAIPVGPSGVLCIRRTLKAGWLAGFITGSGVGVVDFFFGAVAGSGSSLIKDELKKWEQPIRLVGGLVLLGYAFYIWRSKPPKSKQETETDAGSLIKYFLSGFALAISNPTVIFTFAAVYISTGLASKVGGDWLNLLYFVGGLGLGGMLWFAVLCGIVARLKDKFSDKVLARINQLCALFIVLVALYSLVMFVIHATSN